VFNGHEYPYPEDLKNHSEKFLKDVDSYMTKIASYVEPRLKDDFSTLLGFTLPGLPLTPRGSAVMRAAPATHPVYAKLWCEDEFNTLTKAPEEVCYTKPYEAGTDDMESDACVLLGDQGSATRWACNSRLGANAEEEWVPELGLRWVHYVH